MLDIENTIILIIDIQEKLVGMLQNIEIAIKAAKLVKAAGILNIPVIITEQYPKGLGHTISDIKSLTGKNIVYFEKKFFSVAREPGFMKLINSYNRNNILICGIETHVCVYQSAVDLAKKGYNIELLQDISASRTEFDYNTGIDKMKENEIKITSFETALFEFLKSSNSLHFKEIQALIK